MITAPIRHTAPAVASHAAFSGSVVRSLKLGGHSAKEHEVPAAVATAAASILVVVVLPLVPLTSAARCPSASRARASGSMAISTRPPITLPLPRPNRRDSAAVARPAAVAARVRTGRRAAVIAAGRYRRRPA